MTPLEQRLDYTFATPRLLEEALTHPSMAYEERQRGIDNQRLEFLGDAVLQLAITEYLFRDYPSFPEGKLTKLRSRLVSRQALCGYARLLDLGSFLRLGRGEIANGGRDRDSALADAFEALIGALYLDGGLATATRIALDVAAGNLAALAREPDELNPKGRLQEILQSNDNSRPVYDLVDESGPDHAKLFTVRVLWQDNELGRGSGNSKKLAETNAAIDALTRL